MRSKTLRLRVNESRERDPKLSPSSALLQVAIENEEHREDRRSGFPEQGLRDLVHSAHLLHASESLHRHLCLCMRMCM